MHQVNMHEAKSQLSALVEEVLDGGEVVIARAGKPLDHPRLTVHEHPWKTIGSLIESNQWAERKSGSLSAQPEDDRHGHLAGDLALAAAGREESPLADGAQCRPVEYSVTAAVLHGDRLGRAVGAYQDL